VNTDQIPANGWAGITGKSCATYGSRSSLKAFEDYRLFMLAVRWDQNRDRLTDDFFCCVAENSLCTLIPTCDDTIEGLADDCVIAALSEFLGELVFRLQALQ
jgi:hypothetical protein